MKETDFRLQRGLQEASQVKVLKEEEKEEEKEKRKKRRKKKMTEE